MGPNSWITEDYLRQWFTIMMRSGANIPHLVCPCFHCTWWPLSSIFTGNSNERSWHGKVQRSFVYSFLSLSWLVCLLHYTGRLWYHYLQRFCREAPYVEIFSSLAATRHYSPLCIQSNSISRQEEYWGLFAARHDYIREPGRGGQTEADQGSTQ